MHLLLVRPSSHMYSEIFQRLEPLGRERVAGAAREAGHEVRVVDLEVVTHADLAAELISFRPEALGISLNDLANVRQTTRDYRLSDRAARSGVELVLTMDVILR
jgi:magnesium-protoporphyrin IX monomethyl ester (oxidative) cyclase